MSTLNNLLQKVEQKDPQLAADLAKEVKALSARREFGLNFERHIPETVELPRRPIRKGDKVRFLAPRGEAPKSVDQRLWKVTGVQRGRPPGSAPSTTGWPERRCRDGRADRGGPRGGRRVPGSDLSRSALDGKD